MKAANLCASLNCTKTSGVFSTFHNKYESTAPSGGFGPSVSNSASYMFHSISTSSPFQSGPTFTFVNSNCVKVKKKINKKLTI